MIVVKLGGRVAAHAAASLPPGDVVVVHGAGPQISAELERLGLPIEFVGGRRVTSAAALAVVRDSLAAVNAEICAAIGPRAMGLMGDEIGFEAVQLDDLGFVGEPVACAPPAIRAALAAGLVPVVAPLARGPLNVNADEAAAALAVGLGADSILFLTDVPGVFLGGEVVGALGADEADTLLGAGELEGGIVPKLTAAVRAARFGVAAQIGETAVVA